MRRFRWMMAAALLGAFTLRAEVPELLQLVPEAKGYELIAKLNPLKWGADGYIVDYSPGISGEIKRVGYLLKLTGKDGKKCWVFTAMDPFAKEVAQTVVPTQNAPVQQVYVTNLEVAGNVDGLKTGTFEKGNIEFWGKNYGPHNAKNIPGATDKFDFGDAVSGSGSYGSMQVHNYLEKQTVFAFNHLTQNANCDLGIGNNNGEHPDWTFSQSGKTYKDAELYIVGKFDNYKLSEVVQLDGQKVQLTGTTDRNPVEYRAGDPMTFTLTADIGDQPQPTLDYFIVWTRTGDDGKKEEGKTKIADGPVTVKTSIDRPGFVRVQASILDKHGRNVKKSIKVRGHDRLYNISFEGGAGADLAKLTQAAPEPADFDAFWQKQKERLAAVPLKYTMKKVATHDNGDIFAVRIDCTGPRPVTGYLAIPEKAASKPLPVDVRYFGYSTNKQWQPGNPNKDKIEFFVNAHGFDLGKDDAYYKEFANSIKSNGKGYALDPKQNSDPEKAYFNGMALRLMRSLEFVKTLPQWDGKNLIVSGGSQGGLQAIWAAALDHDVTKCDSSITWCSNLAGNAIDKRLAGWHPAWVEALGYYDAVNHAKRVKCPVKISRAGLGDYTCPPSGIAILYNNLDVPKEIVWYQGSTHGYIPPKVKTFSEKQK